MMRTTTRLLIPLVSLLAACDTSPSSPAGPRSSQDSAPAPFPDVITLPNGFAPEGIVFGHGTTFYVASLADGSIFRGEARTGQGSLVVSPQANRIACGVRFDPRGDRLFVAGSATGAAYVYDANTGASLATYQLADPSAGPTAINDIAVLRDAVYFTDDSRAVIYRLPLGPGGALPSANAVQVIPLTGEFQLVPDGINANGIVATPNDEWLIIGNTWTGALYRVDPSTGYAKAIDLVGGPVAWADGFTLIGHTLYVVQGPLNEIAVVTLNGDFSRGVVEGSLTNGALQFPSSIAPLGGSLYAVNAKFDVAPGPNVDYQVVRVSR
jgi:sugar lactone lactonase YvrE